MNGATITSSVGVNTVPTEWIVAGSGDYDGDGQADILWHNTDTNQNWMYLMNGPIVAASVGVNTVSSGDWKIVHKN